MLHLLLSPFANEVLFFNLFRYITFRAFGAMATAIILCFIFGPRFIAWLKLKQGEGQPIRTDGPESHLLTKKGTPTMGGLMMLVSITISTLLWADLLNMYVWVVLGVMLGFGYIGFQDDYLKLTRRSHNGLSGRQKLLLQFTLSVCVAFAVSTLSPPELAHKVAVPFFKEVLINLGIFYALFVMVVIVGASNAVNLTDGLDGLAIVPIMLVAGCFAVFSYMTGNKVLADYLQIHPIAGSGELAIICAAIMGAGMGFLWFNTPPAKVFMGDTGSLSLGAVLGTMAVITKHELVLAIAGGLFVMETLSVIIQVYYYKATKKRFFLMAPIHHHFEKKGWSESTVVIRFWIIAVLFALLALSTLKLR